MMTRLPQWKKGLCLVYGRCSKDTQEGSLDDQYREIEAVGREAGLRSLRDPFEDDGERGHNEDRPGLQAIMEYVRTHPNPARYNDDFIPILVYNVSRFGRFDDEKKIFFYLVSIERYGYEFYSVQDGIRSRGNIADFIQLIIRSQQAYQYTLDLSAYGIRTGCSLADKGWWPGGTAPYAFDRMTHGPDGKPRYRYVTRADKSVEKHTPDGTFLDRLAPIQDHGRVRSPYSDKMPSEKVRLVPDPELAKIARMIFEWFVMEGLGLKKIAAKLNQMGVPAPRGRRWLKSTIRGILMNPAYKGALVYGRRCDGRHHDVRFERGPQGFVARMTRRDVAQRDFVHRPIDQCVLVENCHEAIIPAELWEGAQNKLALRKKGQLGTRGKGARGSSYLLTGDGLMKCVHCGYHYHGSTDRTSKIRYYQDGGYHMGGKEVCKLTLVRADDLEGIVLDAIRQTALGEANPLGGTEADLAAEIERELEASTVPLEPRDSERDALEEKLVALRQKRAEAERFEKEFGAAAADLVKRIREEEQGLIGQLAAKRSGGRARLSQQERRELALAAARYRFNLQAVLEHGSPEERKRFVRDFVAAIEVDGQKRKIRIGLYGGGNSSLRVVPPRGHGPKGNPRCPWRARRVGGAVRAARRGCRLLRSRRSRHALRASCRPRRSLLRSRG